jgi:hypothetical protein
MGTQNQTPSSQPQQPGTRQPGSSGQDEQRPDPRSDRSAKASSKAKEAGNVPRSDDDLTDEGTEGTREDDADSDVRGN